jgi:hypothetical protein
MKYLIVLFTCIISWNGLSQINSEKDKEEMYRDYREDQFYFAITYNLLNNKAGLISQTGFSPGFHLGFIRDMPINKRRNLAIGLGIGLSANSYNQNLSILENNNTVEFTVLDDRQFDITKNRFSTFLIEVPIEFRWRTSTATEYSFWRIYTGMKFGYMFYNTTVLESTAGNERLRNLDVFNRFQYGITFSAGLNTWNVHFYYNLAPLFSNNSQLNGGSIDLSAFKIGLIFYIL